MDEQKVIPNPKPDKWQNWLILLSRWLGGGIAGLGIGLFLFILNETTYIPLFGAVIAGQIELLEDLLFILLSDLFGASDSIDLIALLLFGAIWGIAGALLFSGKKRQIGLGWILLVLFSIIGMVWYVIKSIGVISN